MAFDISSVGLPDAREGSIYRVDSSECVQGIYRVFDDINGAFRPMTGELLPELKAGAEYRLRDCTGGSFALAHIEKEANRYVFKVKTENDAVYAIGDLVSESDSCVRPVTIILGTKSEDNHASIFPIKWEDLESGEIFYLCYNGKIRRVKIQFRLPVERTGYWVEFLAE